MEAEVVEAIVWHFISLFDQVLLTYGRTINVVSSASKIVLRVDWAIEY